MSEPVLEDAGQASGGRGPVLDPAEVFRLHAADVGRWARRLGGPGIDPEEVVQDVFVKVWENLEGFRSEARLTTWLFRITMNEVGCRRRRRSLWSRLFDPGGAPTDEVPAPRPSCLEVLERGEEIEGLYRALEQLKDKYRTPLVLFEIEELPGEQIAEMLGIPLSTLWVRLHRARAQLLQALADQREVQE